MYTLTFHKAHKSIQSLPEVSVPDFMVLTGLNGSGKTHLLEALQNNSVQFKDELIAKNELKYYNWTNLVPKSAVTEHSKYPKEREQFARAFVQRLSIAKMELVNHLRSLPGLAKFKLRELVSMSEDQINDAANRSAQPATISRLKQALDRSYRQIFANYGHMREWVENYVVTHDIDITDVTVDQLIRDLPVNISGTDIFERNLSAICLNYHYLYLRELEFSSTQPNESLLIVRERFEAKNGKAPWLFINEILSSTGLDYTIAEPSLVAPYEAKLRSTTTGQLVSFKDLSSGEKIILSIALCLYSPQNEDEAIAYPKMLLLDEVDAPLHPSMTKQLIDVLHGYLATKRGIKVILTTHSPSTVALSPEECLYRLDKHPNRSITKTSREEAVQLLSNGYVSVTESTKFIIVEAMHDRMLYSDLCQNLTKRSRLMQIPNFVFIHASNEDISSGNTDKGGGGCPQVEKWASRLAEFGIPHVLGLIDGDAGNIASKNIKVLSRYSIENFYLDPIVVYATLMEHGLHEKLCSCSISNQNYFALSTLKDEELQNLVDEVSNQIEQTDFTLKSGSISNFPITYINGKQILQRNWLKEKRGKDLVKIYRNFLYNVLDENGKKCKIPDGNFDALVKMFSRKLLDFIPIDLVSTLREIQIS